MNPLDDGAPAFPSHGSMGEVVQVGMSLRDYFAAKALQGLLANQNTNPLNASSAVDAAYRCADAMLEARKKHAP